MHPRPPGRTFFTGEVGVVTWFVGLVGGDTAMLVEVAVVLLLTDAEGLLLSGGVKELARCLDTRGHFAAHICRII